LSTVQYPHYGLNELYEIQEHKADLTRGILRPTLTLKISLDW
jgi:hypothetical protein